MSTAPDWIQTWISVQREAVERWAPSQKAGMELFAGFLGKLSTQGMGRVSSESPSGVPDWWRAFIPAGALSELPGFIDHQIGLGGSIGPWREHQQLVESLSIALAHYQKVSGDLAVVLADVHRETLDLLARRVQERGNSGQPVEDFKNLYDLWIECGEATYGKVAGGEPYCRLQAELGNAATAVRSLQQQLLERWLKQFDLPTRSELNTLHRRVLDLQRRLDAATVSQPRRASSGHAAGVKRRASRKQAKRS